MQQERFLQCSRREDKDCDVCDKGVNCLRRVNKSKAYLTYVLYIYRWNTK